MQIWAASTGHLRPSHANDHARLLMQLLQAGKTCCRAGARCLCKQSSLNALQELSHIGNSITALQTASQTVNMFIGARFMIGFGLTFAWDEPPKDEQGSLSLQQSLEITSEKSIMRTEAPRWIWYLPTKECVSSCRDSQ